MLKQHPLFILFAFIYMDLVVAGVTLVLASLLPQSTAGMHEIMHCFVDLPSSWRWMNKRPCGDGCLIFIGTVIFLILFIL